MWRNANAKSQECLSTKEARRRTHQDYLDIYILQFRIRIHVNVWAWHSIPYDIACPLMRRLIRVIALQYMSRFSLKHSLDGQQSFCFELLVTEANLSRRWAHSSLVGNAVSWLFYFPSQIQHRWVLVKVIRHNQKKSIWTKHRVVYERRRTSPRISPKCS